MKLVNVFEKAQVQTILNALASIEYNDGRITAKGHAKTIKDNWQITEDVVAAQPLFKKIRQVLQTADFFVNYAAPKAVVGLRFAKYQESGYYGWHVDMAHMNGFRTDMSFTLFLSDKDEYDGGELELDFGQYKQKVKGAAGQMFIYPTGVLHQVTPVTRGDRIVLVGWICSRIPNAEDREALFSLMQESGRLGKLVENPEDMKKMSWLLQYFTRRLSEG
jgi:PKHD-type hydroxylase